MIVGLLNPLDSPHHMRIDDESFYREGIVLDRPVKKGQGSFVNVGLRREIQVDRHLKAGIRVTVKMNTPGILSIHLHLIHLWKVAFQRNSGSLAGYLFMLKCYLPRRILLLASEYRLYSKRLS